MCVFTSFVRGLCVSAIVFEKECLLKIVSTYITIGYGFLMPGITIPSNFNWVYFLMVTLPIPLNGCSGNEKRVHHYICIRGLFTTTIDSKYFFLENQVNKLQCGPPKVQMLHRMPILYRSFHVQKKSEAHVLYSRKKIGYRSNVGILPMKGERCLALLFLSFSKVLRF